MNFAASLYLRKPRPKARRRQFSQDDLFMFEAIVGKPAQVFPADEAAASLPQGGEPIPTVARRWNPADLTGRLRTMCGQTLGHGIKPHVTDWLRQISGQALARLDEAQARLSAARTPGNRRRVIAREVKLGRPIETSQPAKAA
jgi:hypothetical protein